MTSYLTKPEEIDRFCFIPYEENDTVIAEEEQFKFMEKVARENGSKLSYVVDAEGEFVCIAPEAVARYIAELINKDEKP